VTTSGPGQLPTQTLLGCGVDAERISRFRKYVDGSQTPWSRVFSAEEVAQALRATDPARALCEAFCLKEALLKGLERPFDYRQCRLGSLRTDGFHDVELEVELRDEHAIDWAAARVLRPNETECLVIAYLFGRTSPTCEHLEKTP